MKETLKSCKTNPIGSVPAKIIITGVEACCKFFQGLF